MIYPRRNSSANRENRFVRRRMLSKGPPRKKVDSGPASDKKSLENNASIDKMYNASLDAPVEKQRVNSLNSKAESCLTIEEKVTSSALSKKINKITSIESNVSGTAKSEVVFFKKEKIDEIVLASENNSPVPTA